MSGWDWALALATAITVINVVLTIINVRIHRKVK